MEIMQYQLLPDLADDEYEALKADISARGVMVPVEYDEQGNVLDGHHRVRACKELGKKDWPRLTRMGMSEQDKTDHILALNLDRRHLSKEQRAELVSKLREQSWSARRIAKKLSVDDRTVRRDLATSGAANAAPECPDCRSEYTRWEPADSPPDNYYDYEQCSECGYVRRADTVTGIDGKRYPARQGPRSVSLFNASARDIEKAKAVVDSGVPELIAAMDNGDIAVNQAAKIAREDIETQQAIVETIKTKGVRPQEARRRVIAATLAKQEAIMPSGKYRVFYADPPWSYGNSQPDYFGEQRDHYPVMSIAEICALPIQDLAMDNAVLFLWVTSPILEEAFEIVNAWGFKYKASFVWDKVKHVMGHYNSVRHELLLICVRGSCQPDVRKLFDSVVTEERTEHSCKPAMFYEIIETLYTTGPYLELFARDAREGWCAYGYEA